MAATPTHIQWECPVEHVGATPSGFGGDGFAYVTDAELERAKRIVAGAGATPVWALCMADIGLVDARKAQALAEAKQIVRRGERQRQTCTGRERGAWGWQWERNASWKPVKGACDLAEATACRACRFEVQRPAEIHRLRHTCGCSNEHLIWRKYKDHDEDHEQDHEQDYDEDHEQEE